MMLTTLRCGEGGEGGEGGGGGKKNTKQYNCEKKNKYEPNRKTAEQKLHSTIIILYVSMYARVPI